MPYHIKKIQKGTLGEASKIREELDELDDAIDQNNPVMALVELSDIIGAVEQYLMLHHPSVSLEQLIIMSRATQSAFKDKTR